MDFKWTEVTKYKRCRLRREIKSNTRKSGVLIGNRIRSSSAHTIKYSYDLLNTIKFHLGLNHECKNEMLLYYSVSFIFFSIFVRDMFEVCSVMPCFKTLMSQNIWRNCMVSIQLQNVLKIIFAMNISTLLDAQHERFVIMETRIKWPLSKWWIYSLSELCLHFPLNLWYTTSQ